LQKTACFKNALRIAQQLLGSETRCMSDLTILKKEKTTSRIATLQATKILSLTDSSSRQPALFYF
jgi:hypothetical protein